MLLVIKETRIRNILVPIDFSKMSIQAIETAKRLAERFDGAIHLAHVHQFDYPTNFMAPMPPLMPFSAVAFEQDAEKRLARRLSELAKKYGLDSANCHVRTGAPAFDEICGLAQEISADLIVTPTHGRTGLKHVFLGSTTERIVQHSPCPVFVARKRGQRSKNGPAFIINSILVPVDFSGCSLEGLHYGIAFAARVGARVILFHAVHLAPYTSGGFAYDLSALEEAARKDAEHQMQEFIRIAKLGRVKFETAITIGPPVPEICAFAQNNDVNLIITSTHGRTGLEHILIGSTAERVVRHADCSVLVVPSHPDMRAAKLTHESKSAPKSGRGRRPKSES